VRNEFMNEPRPASSLVIVQARAAPSWLVELDAITGSRSESGPRKLSGQSGSHESSPAMDRKRA
jgi:hypothetical protein